VAGCSSIPEVEHNDVGVGTDFLGEIVRFCLYEPRCPELLVELGVSTSMRRNDSDLSSVRSALVQVRDALVEAGGLDAASEPVPMLGRSDRLDVLSLASCVCSLVKRAASSAGCSPEEIADRVCQRLDDEVEDRPADQLAARRS
jgi:hypothetical protein